MNVAHMVGEHTFESQAQSLVHTAISWAPFVIGMCVFFGLVAYLAIKRPKLQFERIKIRRK